MLPKHFPGHFNKQTQTQQWEVRNNQLAASSAIENRATAASSNHLTLETAQRLSLDESSIVRLALQHNSTTLEHVKAFLHLTEKENEWETAIQEWGYLTTQKGHRRKKGNLKEFATLTQKPDDLKVVALFETTLVATLLSTGAEQVVIAEDLVKMIGPIPQNLVTRK